MTINDVGRIGPQDNELEATKKHRDDLKFCLDKEVARVMKLTQQNADLIKSLKRLEVSANTVSYCYKTVKGNFACALRDLDADAASARETMEKAGGEV